MHVTKRSIEVAAAVLAGAVFAGFAFRPKPVAVDTATAQTGTLVTTIDNEARTRVPERYELSSPVAGRHLRVEVHPGDAVSAGAPLVYIDAAPLDPRQTAELQQRLQSAEEVARQAIATQRQAEGVLRQARIDLRRIENLAATGIASANDLDQARTTATNREMELRAARARVNAARHDAEVTRASLLAATPGHSQTLIIRSPVSGSVLNVLHESEAIVAAGVPILEVGDLSSLELVIDVLSRDAVNIAPGQHVVIDEWGGDRPLSATITRTEPAAYTKISALGIEEQRVNVIAAVENPPATLGDRFEVQAHVVLWSGNVLKVPSTAVFHDGGRAAVFVVRNGRAKLQPLKTGHRSADEVEVTGGLTAGTPLIVHPSDQIRDGIRVKAQPAT